MTVTEQKTAIPNHVAQSPLSIHDLTVAYQRKPVIWDVDLDIPEGNSSESSARTGRESPR